MNKLINIVAGLILTTGCAVPDQADKKSAQVNPGIQIDSLTGLVMDQHFELVKGQCTACHSAKLIIQNNASREGWEQMIRWMQKDQGLWDLGENEAKILDYLSLYYGPKKKGRRTPMTNIEWYYLEE